MVVMSKTSLPLPRSNLFYPLDASSGSFNGFIPIADFYSFMFSWWWAVSCPKHVETYCKWNIYLLAASSWCSCLSEIGWWSTQGLEIFENPLRNQRLFTATWDRILWEGKKLILIRFCNYFKSCLTIYFLFKFFILCLIPLVTLHFINQTLRKVRINPYLYATASSPQFTAFVMYKVVQIWPGLIFFCKHNCSSL